MKSKSQFSQPAWLCFFFALLVCPINAVVVEAEDLSPIQAAIQSLDTNALVIFDVDDTLIMPADKILRSGNAVLADRLIQEILNDPIIVPPTKYPENYLHSQAMLGMKPILVDPKIADVIKEVQKAGIPAIALTNIDTGPFGAITKREEWRYNQLHELGIELGNTLKTTHCTFPEFGQGASLPLYERGILFSAKKPKGAVLAAFLNQIKFRPSKIIFIDDKPKYIESVEQTMRENGIETTCYLYKAVKNMPCDVDSQVAQYQFHYLAEHGRWIHDDEAKIRLQLTNPIDQK